MLTYIAIYVFVVDYMKHLPTNYVLQYYKMLMFSFCLTLKYTYISLIHIPYIANRSRRKSFADGQASSNLLENFPSLPTPLIFKKKTC